MELNSLLAMMVEKNASDMFITAGYPPSLKVHGQISTVTPTALSATQAREMVLSIMNTQHREDFVRTQECNFALSVPGIGRFRVNVFQQRGSVGMVLRKIELRIPTLEELYLPPILKELSTIKRGLVLFVGGTGTGKSSSLAAMIGYRNTHGSGHIVTVEDPIEYIHEHKRCIITQREVGLDTESYEAALKNTLRQAPDVILIGEIRARETMEHAIAFTETGHLCLATLHANNANQALDRIINFFPEERRPQLLMDLSFNLKAVVAQLLIPRRDGSGRRAAVEILLNTPLVANYILKGEIHELKALMARSGEAGMRTFDQALFELYSEGEISYDSAIRYADSANEVRLMIKLADKDAVQMLGSSMEGVTLVDTNYR